MGICERIGHCASSRGAGGRGAATPHGRASVDRGGGWESCVQDGIAASCAGERFFRDAPNFAVGHGTMSARTERRRGASSATPNRVLQSPPASIAGTGSCSQSERHVSSLRCPARPRVMRACKQHTPRRHTAARQHVSRVEPEPRICGQQRVAPARWALATRRYCR